MKILTLLAMIFTSACALANPSPPETDCPKPSVLLLLVHDQFLWLTERRPICVTAPGAFKIRIINLSGADVTIGRGDVTARGKDDDKSPKPSLTMSGDNSAKKNILDVKVDGTANLGSEFGVWINVAGVGTLDPTVRVIGKGALQSLKYDTAQEDLQLLGFEPELIDQMLRPILPQQSE
jgi:hypothetical protein